MPRKKVEPKAYVLMRYGRVIGLYLSLKSVAAAKVAYCRANWDRLTCDRYYCTVTPKEPPKSGRACVKLFCDITDHDFDVIPCTIVPANGVSADQLALACAVIKGDAVAAHALADKVCEQANA